MLLYIQIWTGTVTFSPDLKKIMPIVLGWALATAFPKDRGLIWFFHKVSPCANYMRRIPGTYFFLDKWSFPESIVDPVDLDGNKHLIYTRKGHGFIRPEPFKYYVACLSCDTEDKLQYPIPSILGLVPPPVVEALTFSRPQLFNLLDPEIYRVKMLDRKQQCTGTLEFNIQRLREFLGIYGPELKDYLSTPNVEWEVLVGAEYLKLPRMPYQAKVLCRLQTA